MFTGYWQQPESLVVSPGTAIHVNNRDTDIELYRGISILGELTQGVGVVTDRCVGDLNKSVAERRTESADPIAK